MAANYDLMAIQQVVKGYGLDDPQLVEVLKFKNVGEMLDALLPGRRVALTLDAGHYLEDLIKEAAARANLARRLEFQGVSCGLSDALWAAQEAHRKAQEAESSAAASSLDPSGVMRRAEAGQDWRPRKCVRRAAGIGEADRLLMKKWSDRLAAVLETGGTPAWHQAGAAADPAAAVSLSSTA